MRGMYRTACVLFTRSPDQTRRETKQEGDVGAGLGGAEAWGRAAESFFFFFFFLT